MKEELSDDLQDQSLVEHDLNAPTVLDTPSAERRLWLITMSDQFSHLECNHILQHIADNNHVDIPWSELKDIIKTTFIQQCQAIMHDLSDDAMIESCECKKASVLHSIDNHVGTPFTIQRLCELLAQPTRHYTLWIKYVRAVEKTLTVTSTWTRFPDTTAHANGKAYFDTCDYAPIPLETLQAEDMEEDTTTYHSTNGNSLGLLSEPGED